MYILGLRTVICNHQTYIPNLRTAIVAIADFGAMTVWMGMLSSFTTMCANGLQEVIAVLIFAKKTTEIAWCISLSAIFALITRIN